MKGQVGSVDAVVSLSVLAAMLAIWTHMLQDASPIFQIYAYRQTQLYAEHMLNKLLYNISAPWICRTPNDIPVPGCIKSSASIDARADLDKDELNVNCRISCSSVSLPVNNCSDTYPSGTKVSPKVAVPFRVCVGDWNSCTWSSCTLEVWRR